ncbi:hypothetical protein [Marinobacter changyiensis]|uniref:hypothetical protein n=1 Tax=Marinobacter changyiensis TaxID=2604091 RepID=UPI0012659B13|nr:hypothetical protein [Marinobacter changyiensis]
MADKENTHQPADQAPERLDRKFSVSSNRGKGSHKLRYIETGGAAVDTEDCALCQSVPKLSKDREKEAPE